MSLKELTNYAFASALKKLLKSKDFSKIRVTDICHEVGCQRATFYYHFKDKYDLTAWIFTDTMKDLFDTNHHSLDIQKNIKAIENMRKDKTFYKKTLSDDTSELRKYIIDYFCELFTQLVKQNSRQEVLDKELTFTIRYVAHAGFSLTREWVLEESDLTSYEVISFMFNCMPMHLKQYII